MNMIFYIIGIVLWGYGIRLAVTNGIYLDSIFFVIVGGQAVRIGETIADGVELARWKVAPGANREEKTTLCS